jgi:PHD/YefM family antitoxin component YafN of YafNO toxin-antitoxin module
MVREIDLEQVALNLEAAVRDVRDHHNQLVVVHHGKRVMAMIPVEFYDRWFAERERLFSIFDEARAPIQYSDTEVEADVERAIREVREKDADSGSSTQRLLASMVPFAQ